MTERMTKKQIEEYIELRSARDNGRLLTPNGLRFICEAHNNDPEAIGKYFLYYPFIKTSQSFRSDLCKTALSSLLGVSQAASSALLYANYPRKSL